MKRIHALAAIVLLLGLSSCLSTVHPIFTEKDLVFDQKLIGIWGYQKKVVSDTAELNTMKKEKTIKSDELRNFSGRGVSSKQTNDRQAFEAAIDGLVEIRKATNADMNDAPELRKLLGKTYMITHKDKEKNIEGVYFGFLVKLGNSYYMDYYPAETPATKSYDGFYKSHYVKMHTVYRIQFNGTHSFQLKQFDETYMKNLINNKKIRIRHEIREDGSFIVTASTEELQQYILKYSDVPEAYYSDNTSTYNKILNN